MVGPGSSIFCWLAALTLARSVGKADGLCAVESRLVLDDELAVVANAFKLIIERLHRRHRVRHRGKNA